MKKPSTRGFTLIELMVVVAIIAILAMIAYPSYTEQVRKSRRSTAQACLMEAAQYMERYYTTNLAYDQDPNGNPNPLFNNSVATPVRLGCANDLNGFYNFDFSIGPNPTDFTLRATPTGAQANDTCGTLTIDETGDKQPTTAGCWAN